MNTVDFLRMFKNKILERIGNQITTRQIDEITTAYMETLEEVIGHK